jgi:hypothetical protein
MLEFRERSQPLGTKQQADSFGAIARDAVDEIKFKFPDRGGNG